MGRGVSPSFVAEVVGTRLGSLPSNVPSTDPCFMYAKVVCQDVKECLEVPFGRGKVLLGVLWGRREDRFFMMFIVMERIAKELVLQPQSTFVLKPAVAFQIRVVLQDHKQFCTETESVTQQELIRTKLLLIIRIIQNIPEQKTT